MNIGAGNVIVLILVVSFALDRIVTCLLFLLSYDSRKNPFSRFFPDPITMEGVAQRANAEKRQKLAYVIISSIFSIVIIALYGQIRILAALGHVSVLDGVVTWIILVGGSDFIGKFLQMSGVTTEETSTSRPVEITGKLILEERTKKMTEQQPRLL
jgi:hypothetical protein